MNTTAGWANRAACPERKGRLAQQKGRLAQQKGRLAQQKVRLAQQKGRSLTPVAVSDCKAISSLSTCPLSGPFRGLTEHLAIRSLRTLSMGSSVYRLRRTGATPTDERCANARRWATGSRDGRFPTAFSACSHGGPGRWLSARRRRMANNVRSSGTRTRPMHLPARTEHPIECATAPVLGSRDPARGARRTPPAEVAAAVRAARRRGPRDRSANHDRSPRRRRRR